MAKEPKNHRKPWKGQVGALKQLIKQNTPTRVIAMKLDRTEDAIYAKASEENLSLKPVNQSPYNRRKK